jgi:hypothetical protein
MLSGFQAAGLVPVNRELPLNKWFTRDVNEREDSTFRPPGDGAQVLECAFVTGDDRLALLKAKPNPVFPDPPGKIENELALQSHPTLQGRILSIRYGRRSLKDRPPVDFWAKAPKIYAHTFQEGETLWDVIMRLAGDSRIMVVCS